MPPILPYDRWLLAKRRARAPIESGRVHALVGRDEGWLSRRGLRLLAIALASAACPVAAGSFSLSGQVRARVETIDNQPRPGVLASETVLAVRTILAARWESGPLTLTGELRDSRVEGNSRLSAVTANDVNALEPVVAAARLDLGPIAGTGSRLALTAGRMATGLGTFRLVDSPDYRNATNGFTGLRADLALPGGWQAAALWAMPQQRLPSDADGIVRNRPELDREAPERQVWGVDIERTLPGGASLGAIYVGFREADRDRRPTRDRRLHSFGPRFIRPSRPDDWDLEVEGHWQTGTISQTFAPDAPRLPVSAGFVHAELGYRWDIPWQPRLSLRYDLATGDRPGPRFTRFDRLFGNRVADFAVSGLYAAVGRANISSPGVRFEVQPQPGTTAHVSARALWAESGTDSFSTTGVRDPTGAAGRSAGWQLEGRARHWLVDERVRVDLAWATLFRRGLLRDAPNAPPGRTTLYVAPSISYFFG